MFSMRFRRDEDTRGKDCFGKSLRKRKTWSPAASRSDPERGVTRTVGQTCRTDKQAPRVCTGEFLKTLILVRHAT